jgi:itaconate CoA-transferase
LALLHRMVSRADVFIQNLAPGAAARLGLGARMLVERHPALIVVDIVGYGQDTPCRHSRAYDLLVQAESGICAVTGTPETPSKVGVSIADIAAGVNAHAAILEALIARARSGKGKAIEIAMFDCMADWMAVPLLHYEYDGHETGRYGLSHASIYPYRMFTCNGGSIAVAIQQRAEWARFCAGVLRRPELLDDSRFCDNTSRVRNRNALDAEIAAVFATLRMDEVIGRLNENQLAWGRMSTVADAASHPALRKISVPLANGDSYELPRPPGRPELVGRAVPQTGADTERIRAQFAE